jgi:uncharacterized delta-60 repeat protein
MYLLCMLTLPIVAQKPGDLHMAFGQDGIFSAAWEDSYSVTDDMAVLSDGSLVVAGNYIEDSSPDLTMMLIKVSDQGDLMPFSEGARGFEYEISVLNSIQAICVLPDDRIVIAVGANWTLETPHLVMLNAEGEPEMSFSEAGVFTYPQTMFVNDVDFFEYEGETYIIMCGGDEDNQPVLLLIDQTGEPVTSFGHEGMYTLTSIKGSFSELVIDRESMQMYVGGGSFSSPDCEAFLVKYEIPDGYRNSDFGEDGILCFSQESGIIGYIKAIVYEGNSHTLTAFGNMQQEDDTDIFAYRVHAENGTADNSFGINGWSALLVPGSNESLASAVVQPDGRYLFGGLTDFNGNSDFLIGRITASGWLDLTFADNGIKISEIYSGKNNSIKAIALSPDSDILYAAGKTNTPDRIAIAVAAYHTGYEPDTGLGVHENVSGLVNISPNPVKDQIRIHTSQTGLHQVRIFDLAGQTVFHQTFFGENTELSLSFLSPGLYSIQVTLPEKQVGTYKLLKLSLISF